MEELLPPIHHQSYTEDLLSPELRVPQHEPSLSYPQPRGAVSLNAISTSSASKIVPSTVSQCQIEPIDSAHNSLDRKESRTALSPLEASPQIRANDNVAPKTRATGARATGIENDAAEVSSQGNESALRNGPSVSPIESTQAVRSTSSPVLGASGLHLAENRVEGANKVTRREQQSVSSHGRDEGSQEASPRPLPQESREAAKVHQNESSADYPGQRQQQLDQVPVAANENPDTQRNVTSPSSSSIIAEQKQPFLKILSWKRFRASRKKGTSNLEMQQVKERLPQTPDPRQGLSHASQDINDSTAIQNRYTAREGLSVDNNAAVTMNSTLALSTTPTSTTHRVVESLNSSRLYRLQDSVYVGKLKDLSPPASLEISWSATTRKRLITDLQPVLAFLPKSLSRNQTTVELELCMSGRSQAGSGTVDLIPSIWIRCGSKRCMEEVKKAVADLSYLRAWTIHFRLDAPRFACKPGHCSSVILRRATETSQAGPSSVQNSSGSNVGAIVGGVVGGVAALSIIGMLLFFLRRRKKKNVSAQPYPHIPSYTPAPVSDPYKLGSYGQPEMQGTPYPMQSPSAWKPPYMHELPSASMPIADPLYNPFTPDTQLSSSFYGRRDTLEVPPPTYSRPPVLLATQSPDPVLSSSSGPTVRLEPTSADRARPAEKFSTSTNAGRDHNDDDRIDAIPAAPIQEKEVPRPSGAVLSNLSQSIDTSGICSLDSIHNLFDSTCGLRVVFKAERNGITQSFQSTIGGLIRVNEDSYALTTAHTFISLPGYSEEELEADITSSIHSSALTLCSSSSTDGSQIPLSIDFGPTGYPTGKSTIATAPGKQSVRNLEGADFALLKIQREMKPLNFYHSVPGGEAGAETKVEVSDFDDGSAPRGTVSVVCSEDDVRKGFLLQGSSLFMNRTGVWETRKIYFDELLEQGVSGAWVVRGGTLLGIIIAVYDHEPCAHMLPIQKVLSDIRNVVAEDAPSGVQFSLT